MGIDFILFFVFVVLIIFLYKFHWKRRQSYPPGPKPWPLFGNLFELLNAKTPGYELAIEWRKKYGPVYTYWLLEMPMVAVADYPSIYESFIKNGDAYADRVNYEQITKIFRGGNYGILTTDGPLWKDQRRFTLNVLKHFGMGKNLMEEKILDEISFLIKNLHENAENSIDMIDNFDVCVGSIIAALLFGFRYDQKRLSEYRKLKHMLASHLRMCAHSTTAILFMMPNVLRWIPGFSKIYNQLISNRDEMFDYFNRQIQEHQKNLETESKTGFINETDPKDFIEAYLLEMQKREERLKNDGIQNSDDDFYCLSQLQNIVLDIFIAGQVLTYSLTVMFKETTSLTLSFLLIYILNNPNVQDKIHVELDSFKARIVTYSGRQKLPYLNAVIHESQRLANLLPKNIVHKTSKDVEINGLKIPKDTCIGPEISCVLYDDQVSSWVYFFSFKIFPKPYKFLPERFLDKNGQLKKYEEFIPFSVGKRSCIGEQLARMELFLITSNLFNNFKFHVIDGEHPPSMEKKAGITVQPYPFKCKVVPKDSSFE